MTMGKINYKVGDSVRRKSDYINDEVFIRNPEAVYTVKELNNNMDSVKLFEINGNWDADKFDLVQSVNGKPLPTNSIMPERYIINQNATILFWQDGSKTVVRKNKGGSKTVVDKETGKKKKVKYEPDKFDKRIGFLYAYFQRNSGMSRNQANKYIESLEIEEEVK